MSNTSKQIADWRGVDAATFRDQIVPKNQPAVLRGIALQWPAVQRGSPSPQAMCSYLMSLQQGGPVPLLTAEPAIQGRFFFRDDMRATGDHAVARPTLSSARVQAVRIEFHDALRFCGDSDSDAALPRAACTRA
jgi:hypothetical protein